MFDVLKNPKLLFRLFREKLAEKKLLYWSSIRRILRKNKKSLLPNQVKITDNSSISSIFTTFLALFIVGFSLFIRPISCNLKAKTADWDQVCVREDPERLVRIPCEDDENLLSASNRVRTAVGAPYCWWTISENELSSVNGVGRVLSARIMEEHDLVGIPTIDNLTHLHGVGPRLAEAISERITYHCQQ